MSTTNRNDVPAYPAPMVATALAPVAVLAGAGSVVMAAVFGIHPMWPVVDMTLSEAAALRDRGEIVRLVADGRDPDTPWAVRAGVLTQDAITLVPLEAAVRARRLEVVRVLLDNGSTMDVALRRRLVCVAVDVGAADIVGFLAGEDADLPAACGDVADTS